MMEKYFIFASGISVRSSFDLVSNNFTKKLEKNSFEFPRTDKNVAGDNYEKQRTRNRIKTNIETTEG